MTLSFILVFLVKLIRLFVLQNDGVIIYVAGVGSGFELDGVASKTAYVLSTSNYTSLQELSGPLGRVTCEGELKTLIRLFIYIG